MGKIVAIPVGILGCGVVFFVCVSCTFFTLFLQTLNILSGETVVAEVIMGPIQEDGGGKYIDIEFTPYVYKSALESIAPGNTGIPTIGEPQNYRVYGDHVGIKGPYIKLHPLLGILGYNNMYKLALIEGEYRFPENQTQNEGSEIWINGGFEASWWNTNDLEYIFPYNTYIERFTFSGDEEPGFRGNNRRRYEVVATFDTITWNLKGEISN